MHLLYLCLHIVGLGLLCTHLVHYLWFKGAYRKEKVEDAPLETQYYLQQQKRKYRAQLFLAAGCYCLLLVASF